MKLDKGIAVDLAVGAGLKTQCGAYTVRYSYIPGKQRRAFSRKILRSTVPGNASPWT